MSTSPLDRPKGKPRGVPFKKGDPRIRQKGQMPKTGGRKPTRTFREILEAALKETVQVKGTRKQVIEVISERLLIMAREGDLKAAQEVFKIIGAYAPVETDNKYSGGPIVLTFTTASPGAGTDTTT